MVKVMLVPMPVLVLALVVLMPTQVLVEDEVQPQLEPKQAQN